MNRRRVVVASVLFVAALVAGAIVRRGSVRPRGEATLRAALARLVAADVESARLLADAARSSLPHSADAALVAAAAEAAGGDLRAAYVSAERAAVLAPRDAEKALAAGLVAREMAQQSGNEAWPDRARTWLDAAVARAEAAAEARPGEAVPGLVSAAARLAGGEPERALGRLASVAPRTASEREQVGVLRGAAYHALASRPGRSGPGVPTTRSIAHEARRHPTTSTTTRPAAPSAGTKPPPAAPPSGLPTASLDARRGIAKSFQLYVDDRAGFDAALQSERSSSVTDSGGAFASDPTAGTGQSSISRSGTVDGKGFGYTAYDIDFSNTPDGTIVPGTAGGDLADLDNVNVERPAAQGTATGSGTWGLDGATGSTTSRNALLVDFTTTPDGLGIGHFGLDLIDFEAASAFTRGELRLYDGGILVFSSLFDWSPSDDGNNRVHFLGVVAVAPDPRYFDQAVVVLGDDSAGGGLSEQWAADRFTFGRAVANPEPGTWALFGVGVAALVVLVAKRRFAPDVGDPPPPAAGAPG